MSKPSPLERLVVIARNSSDPLQAFVLDRVDPAPKLEGDVVWHAFEILLGPPAQPNRADHDGIVHPSGVHAALKGRLRLPRPPKKLKVANCDLELIALDMVLALD